jgi:hypothetical protein
MKKDLEDQVNEFLDGLKNGTSKPLIIDGTGGTEFTLDQARNAAKAIIDQTEDFLIFGAKDTTDKKHHQGMFGLHGNARSVVQGLLRAMREDKKLFTAFKLEMAKFLIDDLKDDDDDDDDEE